MSKSELAVLCGASLLLGCGAGNDDAGDGSDSIVSVSDTNADTGGGDGDSDDAADDNGDSNADSDSNDDEGGGDGSVVFDVGAGGANACMGKEAGVYCIMDAAVECDGEGNEVANNTCIPGYCMETLGCVPCLEGMHDCTGADVLRCNTDGAVPQWEIIETCDPGALMVCDIALGTCVPTAPVGTTEPTGEYFKYADFPTGSVFQGGYDVDGIDNTLYITQYGMGIAVYTVELLDSDGDGLLEPNQHPDNPDEMGPIEVRELTFVEHIPYAGQILSGSGELFSIEDRIFVGGYEIDEHIFATGVESVIATPPSTMRPAQMGYDEVNGIWYSSNEGNRRVYQRAPDAENWGIAFDYPPLAGSHMDGMEVVPDPNTGTVFVYVSDMTSDFIGQYRKDPYMGWVQENLFSYVDSSSVAVEGMGFGAFNHFWATSGVSLYEVGGGDLQTFVEPQG